MEQLPLFPLRTVVCPGGILSLRIFEPRYLDMVSGCLRHDSGFGVCLIREGNETGQPAKTYLIGTECKIVDWESLPGGLLGITVQGENKFKLLNSHSQTDNLLIGDIEVLENEDERPLPPEFDSLSQLLVGIIGELGRSYRETHYHQSGWVGMRLVELLPLELPVKQHLFELEDPLVRLFQLRDAMVNMHYLQS